MKKPSISSLIPKLEFSSEKFEEQRKKKLLSLLFLLASGITLPFFTHHLIVRDYTNASILGGLLLLWGGNLWQLHRGKLSLHIFRFTWVVLFLVELYLADRGAASGTQILWILIFPPVSFFIFGRKEGWRWSLSIFIGVAIFLFFPGITHDEPIFSSAFRVRYLGVYLGITLIASILDTFQLHFYQEVKKNAEKLELLNGQLAQELSDRKEAELEARRFRCILEQADEAIFIIERDSMVIVDSNQRACLHLGYSKQELLQCCLGDFEIRGSRGETLSSYLDSAQPFKQGGQTTQEGSCRRKNSNRFPIEFTLTEEKFEGSHLLLLTLRDITEQKQVLEKLQESEERFRVIADQAPLGILQTTTQGTITWANPKICQLLGYEANALIGKKVIDLTHPKHQKDSRSLTRKMERGQINTYHTEQRLLPQKSEAIWVRMNVAPLTVGEGKERKYNIAIIEDISQKKRVEEELIHTRDYLEEMVQQRTEELEAAIESGKIANRAKTQFLTNMSHEIRTPLNGILGMTALGLESSLGDNERIFFETIRSEADSLLMIVNEILDISKVESGKLEFDEIDFDLRILVEGISKIMALQAEQKGLEFISLLAPGIPSLLVGDPVRIRQIIANLGGNALKFTQQGEVFIYGELVEDFGEHVKIRFLIKDTGIGITPEQQKLIFESFTQADGSTTRNYGGTGLGTTIAKQLVSQMNGEIWVESEEGLGSTFGFTLLLKKQEYKQLPVYNKALTLKGLRVLVAEPFYRNREAMKEYLDYWECESIYAVDGAQALELLLENQRTNQAIDLILCDLQMPILDGFELAKQVREHDTLKSIPIVGVTKAGQRGDGKKCIEYGIDGYISKPFEKQILYQTIIKVLEGDTKNSPTQPSQLVTRHSLEQQYRKDIQILLVEDYPTNQQVAQWYLESAGYQVDLAVDGYKAVEAFKIKKYDLILMDIQMPIMDGYDATREIRQMEQKLRDLGPEGEEPWGQRVPIIAMTAHAMKGYREKCLKVGMDDYLAKPLRKEKLITMVDTLVSPKIGAEAEQVLATAIMEFEKTVEEFEGDRDFLIHILGSFLQNVKRQQGELRQALEDKNYEFIQKTAHAIKGGAANLLAIPFSQAASELERVGRQSDHQRGALAYQSFEQEYQRLVEYTKQFLLK